jgi:hypothetical protein
MKTSPEQSRFKVYDPQNVLGLSERFEKFRFGSTVVEPVTGASAQESL